MEEVLESIDRVDKFKKAIEAVCKEHHLCLTWDSEGFVITNYDDEEDMWNIRHAFIDSFVLENKSEL